MYAIIGAMDQEIEQILKMMNGVQVYHFNDHPFYQGLINDKIVILVKSGIGKVASAMTTTILLTNFTVEALINIGTCGGVENKVDVEDLIIGQELVYGDVDLQAFKYPYGQMAGQPLSFKSNPALIARIKEISKHANLNPKLGNLMSSDAFIVDKLVMQERIRMLDMPILGVDMESASIAQIATSFKKPFVVLRFVSDIIGMEHQVKSFDKLVAESSLKIAQILKELIK
jgi:adenosylhomocysteine nucleosidase